MWMVFCLENNSPQPLSSQREGRTQSAGVSKNYDEVFL